MQNCIVIFNKEKAGIMIIWIAALPRSRVWVLCVQKFKGYSPRAFLNRAIDSISNWSLHMARKIYQSSIGSSAKALPEFFPYSLFHIFRRIHYVNLIPRVFILCNISATEMLFTTWSSQGIFISLEPKLIFSIRVPKLLKNVKIFQQLQNHSSLV